MRDLKEEAFHIMNTLKLEKAVTEGQCSVKAKKMVRMINTGGTVALQLFLHTEQRKFVLQHKISNS